MLDQYYDVDINDIAHNLTISISTCTDEVEKSIILSISINRDLYNCVKTNITISIKMTISTSMLTLKNSFKSSCIKSLSISITTNERLNDGIQRL